MFVKRIISRLYLILVVSITLSNISIAQNVDINERHSSALGTNITVINDPKSSLSANVVLTKFHQGLGTKQSENYLNFGLNSSPIWLVLPIKNNDNLNTIKRLSIETPWLDNLNIYLFSQNRKVYEAALGDRFKVSTKPINSRYFDMDIEFPSGDS